MLLEGLVPTDVIDEAVADLRVIFPSAAASTPIPTVSASVGSGGRRDRPEPYVWPEDGPGFRPEQHRWQAQFPFPGSGALNRLCVYPTIVDFAERALQSADIRLYQIHLAAKYAGEANYEQPMHTDRNHSWLPAIERGAVPQPRDVPLPLRRRRRQRADAPRAAPRFRRPRRRRCGVSCRRATPSCTRPRFPRPASAARCSRTATTCSTAASTVTRPDAARFLMALAFKRAGQDWIGYSAPQSQSTSLDWVKFAEASTPRELELFGFPPPGHDVWTAELLAATAAALPETRPGSVATIANVIR